MPTGKLLRVPDHVGIDVATCLPVQGLTAHYLTTDAHAKLCVPGQWMLIHGVGGGTCQWAAQMAKAMGYKVIGTVAEGKKDVGAACGVDELIVLPEVAGTSYEDYEAVDVAARVKEVTGGEGCHAVIDGIGKNTLDISINSLAQRGIFVSFGNASGAVPAFPPLRLINKSGFLTRPKLNDYTVTREELLQRANDIYGWIHSGDLKVAVRILGPSFLSFFVTFYFTTTSASRTSMRQKISRNRGFHMSEPCLKQSFEASRSARHQTFSRPSRVTVPYRLLNPIKHILTFSFLLPPQVDRCFPLEQAVEGHDYLEAGKSRGKVLYEI